MAGGSGMMAGSSGMMAGGSGMMAGSGRQMAGVSLASDFLPLGPAQRSVRDTMSYIRTVRTDSTPFPNPR